MYKGYKACVKCTIRSAAVGVCTLGAQNADGGERVCQRFSAEVRLRRISSCGLLSDCSMIHLSSKARET